MTSPKKIIADSFSRSAHRYDQAAIVQQQAGNDLLGLMKNTLQPGLHQVNTVADIGCGTGYFAPTLMNTYHPKKYIGIDISEGMLNVAEKNNQNAMNMQWLCCDAENLLLENASVDLIYANFSLQWCENLSVLMHNFRRVLTANGHCCFTSLGQNTLAELRGSWESVDQLAHVNQFYPSTQWTAAIEQPEGKQTGGKQTGMENQGLDIIHHQQTTAVQYFDTVIAALRSLKDIGANVVTAEHRQGLTGKQRFAEFVRAYETYRTPKGIPVSYEVDSWIIQKI
ncbi:MAG: malonyl-CoA O-methyltransferase [Candidatus Endobugula sp.]